MSSSSSSRTFSLLSISLSLSHFLVCAVGLVALCPLVSTHLFADSQSRCIVLFIIHFKISVSRPNSSWRIRLPALSWSSAHFRRS
ncbi:hypothetical protein EV401DRAFT_2039363 [Pisolithus croceorrhizus]|nr:hypothetical protein EV401DRAFT_2039363 [Pisolithus croceorrhizus]